ncbi:MAG TPA: translation initiation factor IF-2 [Methylomirabilota bacterium]|nr:translation initiation factor IF-2 [Methylomirabilota bacterium]
MAKDNKTTINETQQFPPVVAVLGHVDHGKTTLLDAIRKTSIADREHGGITQKIGASAVEIVHDDKKRWITFIDTPGHEAFAKMRGRGAQAADIALLIVSAGDGVKPQTRESIVVLQATQTPFIVVLTKSDLPTKNPEKVKQELLKEKILLEGYGGDVPVIEVSAKTNSNIKELLDLILLMFDMHKPADYAEKVSASASLQAIIIEAKLDNRAGAKATAIIKNGSIKVREEVLADGQVFKVRTILDILGKPIQEASVGQAVELLGFNQVPSVGGLITAKETFSKDVVTVPAQVLKRELIYKKEVKHDGISALLIADTQGSLEAIINALPEKIKLLTKKTGEVTEADILLAKSTGSIVLSFNTKLKPDVSRLAFTEKVLLRNYTIIYELLDEVKDALEGKLQAQMEQIFGRARVLAKFPFEKTFAFGVTVVEGRIARGDRLRIMRGEEVVGEGSINSLRIAKNPTSKVEKGHEAGIIITPDLDIQVGDMILSHS